MDFIFEQIRVGGDRNFSYLVGDRQAGVAVCVDPAHDPGKVLERAKAQNVSLTYIINTHGHEDHINGNEMVRTQSNALTAGYEHATFPHDLSLKDGDTLQIGKYTLQFYYTPGHAEDHLVVYLKEKDILLSGDLIFVGKVGGTVSDSDAKLEWESLQKIVELFQDSTTIWPGHDYGCRPSSTLGLEKTCNPFLLCKSFEELRSLKINWPAFKKDNGLM